MSIRFPDDELMKTLDDYRQDVNAGPYEIGLFSNNVTVTTTNSIGDFTITTFGGYSGWQDLDSFASPTWSSPRAQSAHPDVTWTCNGTSSDSVWGYVVRDASGNLAWFEKRSSAVTIDTNGQRYVVSPQITRRSEF